ncbi:hypothetical protein RHGRI_012985 [Rhododendron griersonianum]|uniref:Uncharacterized protein n=1 Tax=Rhododendron griersonianum TaxID=479676 RepID=A0AAV6K3W7_9ERIC|nr:hypothetical protein RHGRI_012985 [Rhododendron griersonianum]
MSNTTPDLRPLCLRCCLNPFFFILNSSFLNPQIRAEAKLNGNDNGVPFVGTEGNKRRSTGEKGIYSKLLKLLLNNQG